MNPLRATSADVARRAGVSRATVSYVLNDSPHQSIPMATRERVLAAASELDYTPHAAARALRAGESKLVLLINTGVPYGTNLSVMIDALAAEVSASGRSLMVWQQRNPEDLAATVAHLQPVVALTLGSLTADQRQLLERRRIPGVETGVDAANPVDVGAALQIRHLLDRGHRRLGYLTTAQPRLAMFTVPRLAAVRATCAEAGLPAPLVAELDEPDEVAVSELTRLLSDWTGRADPVTALACYNDVWAAAALTAADRARIAVPGRLAVVWMDDEAMSAFTRPALSTVRLHMVDYARHLWHRALAELSGATVPDLAAAVHVSLVQRAST